MRRLRLTLALAGVVTLRATAIAQGTSPLPPVRIEGKAPVGRDGRWPDSLRTRMRDSLARGRARWEQSRPSEYVVGVISTWAMARMVRTDVIDGQLEAVRVRGNRITGLARRTAPQFTPAPDWRHVTIDSVFRRLEMTLADSTQQIATLKLDPAWGFPREWKTDDARNGFSSSFATDQASGGAIVFFEETPPSACNIVRRVLRRCRST